MRSTQSRLRGLAGIVAGTLVVSTLGAAPTQADESAEPLPHIELQARTNLLVNDEGWNVPPGSSFNSITTALSDDAQIAFPLQVATMPGDPTSYTAAVWLGQGGEGELVHRLPVNSSISSTVHINNAGDVAFTAGDATANVLFLYDAALDAASQISTMPVVPTSYSLGGVDEDQNVGFQGNFAGSRAFAAVIEGEGVFYAQDEGLDPDSEFSYLYSAAFNDAQQIAAKVSLLESFNHQEVRIFEADGSSQTVLATDNVDPDSPYRAFDNSVGLSDNGQVAAFATLREGNTKVLVRTDGTTVEHVADVSADSPLASFDFFAPTINDAGEVAFRAVDKEGNRGVWVADGDSLRPALVEGDVVQTDLGVAQLGQHDNSPVFGGSPQINNRGDVSITAGVHPEGDNQVEWGSGVFISYAEDSEPEPPVGVIEVDPTSVDHEVEFGGSATTDVTFTNTGEGDADVTLAADEDWVSLDPSAFTVEADSAVNVAFTTDAAGMESGTYTAQVAITTDTGQDLTPVEVTMTVDEEAEPPVEPIVVERWEGGNRYGTAVAISSTYEAGVDVVFLATGHDYPDALAGSALAGALDVPVLLTRFDELPNSTTAELERLNPERVVVLGGSGVVADDVLTQAADVTGAPVDRISGTDRYRTAAAVAAEFDGGVERVFVATGRDYPDALSAAARAGALGSPVLLVRPDGIPSATAAALDTLAPDQITVLGGDSVVEDAVLEQLADWAPTERIGGPNRWITSALLFAEVAAAQTVYLASGQDWPDALAGGAKAAGEHEPLLITRTDGLPGAIEDAIVRLFPDKVVVLGGTGAVSDDVIEELEELRGQD